MTTSYLPYAPGQQLLLPAALQDWLPEGHLAYFISDTIDSLELSAFHAHYAKGGPRNQPYHPAMMVKVLVYGYATGVFSSRKLAKKLHEDVAFRVLAAGNFPAHRTICDFRALHLEELSGLFVQVVRLARECGLVKLGTIAVDGTKIKANASRHKAMSYERMQKADTELKGQIDALLARATATDEAEKNEPELDVPAEIARRENRLAVIRAAKERLEQRQREAPVELIVALGREGKEKLAIDIAQYPRTAEMAGKLQTDKARAAYRRRKWLSEPPNGWIKNVLGFRQFSLRGLAKVQAEWRLVCAALNLRRMATLMSA